MKELIARLKLLDEKGYQALTGPIGKEAADALTTLTSGDVSIPEGDRFVDPMKFRVLGLWSGNKLYECWSDAVQDYGDRRAAAAVLAERERCIAICERLRWTREEFIAAIRKGTP